MCKTISFLFTFGIVGFLYSSDVFNFEVQPADLNGVALNEEERAAGDYMWMRRRDGIIVGSYHAEVPASTLVQIPANGEYYLWVNYQTSQSRRRPFAIHLGDQEVIFAAEPYGEQPSTETGRDAKGFVWSNERLPLKAGDITLLLVTNPRVPYSTQKPVPRNPPLVRGLIITNDPNFKPPVQFPENEP